MKTLPRILSFLTIAIACAIPFAAWAAGPPPDGNYALQVARGTGSGSYPPGTKVSIAIDPKASAKLGRFYRWNAYASSTKEYPVDRTSLLADPASPATTFAMPAEKITVEGYFHPFVHQLFTDNMVLQRDMPAPVWGWTDPGAEVAVECAGQSVKAVADKEGRWEARLAPMAAGGPHELKISGPQSVTLKNILIGDVWICSGQSNMQGTMEKSDALPENVATIRYLTLFPGNRGGPELPLQDLSGHNDSSGWKEISTTKGNLGLSRTAFFFGHALNEHLQVPIGVVTPALNGSPIEAWMPKKTLMAIPHYVKDGQLVIDWKLPDWRWEDPYVRYNGWIHPLAPFACKGFLWYQGETNAGRNPMEYRDLLALMIRDWRALWGGREIPFIAIQMHQFGNLDANRSPDSGRNKQLELQESQLAVGRSVPAAATAVTIDLGAGESLHPPNKKGIGERAALVARSLAYGERIPAYGPLYKSMQVDGSKIQLAFESLGGGLMAKGGEPLKYFAIAGADQKWEWADAQIVGDNVVVSSAKVQSPVAVRYAWGGGQQEANLFNKAGLPAPAFRTDNWVPEAKK